MAAVIVGFARTPFAKYMGAFATIPATTLGAHAIRAALERAGVAGDQVDRVLMGQELQGGAGQGPARQAAVGGGVPLTVPAATINAVCLSGTEAVVPVLPVVDTVKRVDPDTDVVLETVDRGVLRAVQTPQGFRRTVLARAHAHAGTLDATDDAGLVEALGLQVRVVPGHPEAFKVTRPLALVLAEAVVSRRRAAGVR